METIAINKKVTTGTLGLDGPTLLAAVREAKGKAVDVSEVLAMVTGYKGAASRYNAQNTDYRFSGQFEATNLLTGEIMRANEAYFPGAAGEWLRNAFDDCNPDSKDGKAGAKTKMPALAFTITVKAMKKQDGTDGYQYGVKALVEKSLLADPFADLRKELPSRKKLAAK